ncbi:MAG TPA: PTS sugar transporter subunit IIC [Gemmatimonadales bacterium]|nr:PTS sugar transporter subunit IIC [Gemmatimonadales bacterium]
MSEPSLAALAGVTAWATVAGVDLVSVPQGLLSRPLVVGALAGCILGEPGTGLAAGVALELYALDVMPVGAARYPDYGAATAGATVAAAGLEGPWAGGPALALALALAWLGGLSLEYLRQANARAVHRRAAALATGDPRVIGALQLRGLARDTLRSAALAVVAVAAGAALARAWPMTGMGSTAAAALTIGLVGAGLSGAASGALRNAGRGLRLRWLGLGAVLGVLLAVFR